MLENQYLKAALAIAFIFAVMNMAGLGFKQILDLPTFLFLAAGTALTTLLSRRKGMETAVLLAKAKRNCLITGFFGLFIGVMAVLTGPGSLEILMPNMAVSLLMVPYTAVFYLGIHYGQAYLSEGSRDADGSRDNAAGFEYLDSCDLSGREKEIARALLEGRANKEIAERLYITESTVKKHISNIYRKAGVKSRHELVCQTRRTTSG